MSHLQEENLAFVSLRRQRGQGEWNFSFVGKNPVDKSFITSLDNAFVFPLYLYTSPEETVGTLFAQAKTTRVANLNPQFIEEFSTKLRLHSLSDGAGDLLTNFGPEDVFHYIYAVFHSPTYRKRYPEFLKIDFPRLPLTSNRTLFVALAEKGHELVDLHLLRSPKIDNYITTYSVGGDHQVKKVQYAGDKVWINTNQYFGGVPKAVWKFQIGGYQVCEKWLKDRKGRRLSGEDINHYQQVVVALNETIRLMQEIDVVIPGWPIE